jgi:hypothetical protein
MRIILILITIICVNVNELKSSSILDKTTSSDIYYNEYKMTRTCNLSWKFFETTLKIETPISYSTFIRDRPVGSICDMDASVCCSGSIEQNLHNLALNTYTDTLLKKDLLTLKSSFISYVSTFDPIVKGILDRSQEDFDKMFNATYNTRNSEQVNRNRLVFIEFFEDVKKFYGDYPIDISKVIRKVFISLTKIMYNLLNSNYTIHKKSSDEDQAILFECIDKSFDSINPLGSKLPKLTEDKLTKALQAVKLFTSGLTRTRDIIIEMYSLFERPSEECKRSLTKITACSACTQSFSQLITKNLASVRPCFDSCLTVYKKCIGIDLERLNPIWNSYLG